MNRTVVERVLSEVVAEWQEQQDLKDDETIYVSRHILTRVFGSLKYPE